MGQRAFNTSPTPDVRILLVEGNLTVKGWDTDEIVFKGSAEDTIEFDQAADSLSVTCMGDCLMRLPVAANLTIGQVNGEARLKLLEEALSVDIVEGNLVLSHLSEVNVRQVNGELIAKHLSGDLQVEAVEGSAIVKEVQGSARLSHVSGNLEARGIEGSIYAAVEGNAHLRLSSLEGDEVQVSANGNLDCRIRAEVSAEVHLSSSAGRIQVDGPQGKTLIRETEHNLTLGDGEARLVLSAEGNLYFSSQDESWAEFGEVGAEADAVFNDQIADQIGRQVEAQMQALSRQLEDQMAQLSSMAGRVGMSPERMEQIMQRARETSERAAARAQEKMRRAQEKIERKMEAAQRKAEARARAAERRGTRSWGTSFGPNPAPATPQPVAEPVSDEERMLILRMLEEKKITLDEAERLLAALEGKGE